MLKPKAKEKYRKITHIEPFSWKTKDTLLLAVDIRILIFLKHIKICIDIKIQEQ